MSISFAEAGEAARQAYLSSTGPIVKGVQRVGATEGMLMCSAVVRAEESKEWEIEKGEGGLARVRLDRI